jgi:hypothetical protein
VAEFSDVSSLSFFFLASNAAATATSLSEEVSMSNGTFDAFFFASLWDNVAELLCSPLFMLAQSQIQEIQGIKNIKTGISLGNMGEIQIVVRQMPGFKAASAIKTSGPALQPDSAACPRVGILYISWIYLEYTWYIPGMTLIMIYL